MRTKTLLLSAATLAAGVATSMAANVYSINVVGYINITVQPGYNLIANQLDVDGVDAIGTVLNAGTPSSQEGANLLRFVGGNFTTDTYTSTLDDGFGLVGWFDGNTQAASTNTIPPGVGFFYFNPDSVADTLTLTGTVLQGSHSVAVPAGYSLISTIAPQAITLDTTATNNFPAQEGDNYLQFVGGNFITDTYTSTLDDGFGFIGWFDINSAQTYPTPAVGAGFFYFNGNSSTTWTRTFNVQ